jgi:hypothetical protein
MNFDDLTEEEIAENEEFLRSAYLDPSWEDEQASHRRDKGWGVKAQNKSCDIN